MRKRILLRMVGNVLLDSLVGAVPILGDIADAAWKANARNMRLVEASYIPGTRERPLGRIIAFGLVTVVAVYGVVFSAFYFLASAILSLFN